ncbi:MAG: rhodanese-like domain-containing protein [Desulfobacterales bacterium]|nr:MAG: rhodanese-like domain-containing protein [Desulfobacterales bacterium]
MMVRFRIISILLTLSLAGMLIPDVWSDTKVKYQNVDVDQFLAMMDNKDFVLINVHIPYQGEIPQTDLLIPFNMIDQHRNELPKDKDAKMFVYCMTGPMGYIAAEKLVNMGYTNVFHFEGGMKAWARSGRQLVNRKK